MTDLPAEAIDRLRAWLPADDDPDRPQVQLATVDADGLPDVRTVLLSSWSAHGLVFHTDARSRKAQQLAAVPAAAALVLWPNFSRQLVVRGPVEQTDDAERVASFSARPPYLRQLAWQNSTELAQLPAAERRASWSAFVEYGHGAPSTWAGYRIRPTRVTFWEPDAEGPSHRVEFRRGGDGRWAAHHLAG